MNLQLFYICLFHPSASILLTLAATRPSIRDVAAPSERNLPDWARKPPQDPYIYELSADGNTDSVKAQRRIRRGSGCSRLSVSNGYVSPGASSYSRGSTVTYHCNSGYRLVGSSTRSCGSNGRWSGSSPSCQMITCGDPGTVANGQRTLTDGFNHNSHARYTCNSGSTMHGSAVLQCEESGRWSAAPPTCQQIGCPELVRPESGMVTSTNGHAYNAVATYSCYEGLSLQGSVSRRCHINGRWDGEEPQCIEIKCRDLPVPSHGYLSYTKELTFGSVVHYACDLGYRLVGEDSTRTCEGTAVLGTWSGTPASCEIVTCPDLETPKHSVVHGYSTTYGSTVSFQCLDGYAINGPTKTECQSDGEWSAVCKNHTVPVCIACPLNTYKPGTNIQPCRPCPDHSHTTQPGGMAVTQCVCDEGYRGPGGGPCEYISCPDLALPTHAVLVSCNKTYQGRCTFDCKEGYVQNSGDDVRVCGIDRVWSGTDIICKACPLNSYESSSGMCQQCPAHSHTLDIGNGDITGCVCDAGYQNFDDPSTHCSDLDECAVGNGGCQQTCENNPGSYICLCTIPGFVTDEEDPRNCTEKNKCPELAAPENGGYVCVKQSLTNSKRCQIKCDAGYDHVLRVNNYEECGPSTNWMWSHSLMEQPILPCKAPFFEGFQMEAEVHYFVSSCDSLTPSQIDAAKQEFLSFLLDQNVCDTAGMMQCSISDVRLECGVQPARRRKRSSPDIPLKFTFIVAVPSVPQSEVNCDDICSDQSFCEEDCAINYHTAVESTFVAVSDTITDIFNTNKTQLPQAPGPSQSPQDTNATEVEERPTVTFGGILLVPDTVVVQEVSSSCDVGFASRNGSCVPCPAGFYFADSQCHLCPKKTYQPEVQALECLPCPTAKEKGLRDCPPANNFFDAIIEAAENVVRNVTGAINNIFHI